MKTNDDNRSFTKTFSDKEGDLLGKSSRGQAS